MKKIALVILCGVLLFSVVGCGTVQGIGKDVSTVGKWITRSSESSK